MEMEETMFLALVGGCRDVAASSCRHLPWLLNLFPSLLCCLAGCRVGPGVFYTETTRSVSGILRRFTKDVVSIQVSALVACQ